MRIALWQNLPSGGGKRCFVDQLDGLRALGHEVAAWTTPQAARDFLPIEGERVVPLDVPERRSFRERLLKTEAMIEAFDRNAEATAREIEAEGFDVVLAHSSMVMHCPPLAKYLRTPSVLYLHEPNRPLFDALPDNPWAARERTGSSLDELKKDAKDALIIRAFRILVREEVRNARAFGRILTNSLFTREALLRAMGLDGFSCPPGIDTETFTPLWTGERAEILGVGAVQPHKNVEFLIESVALLRDPARRRLRWIGNAPQGDYRSKLESLAKERGVQLRIDTDVPDAELLAALRGAAVFVYAPRLEPLGLTPLEAMACGVPVVAVAEGGCRETVRDGQNGFLVDNVPVAFAAAVDRLLDDPDLARRMGEAGRVWVEERWTRTAATARLEAHLRAMVSA